MHLLFLPNERRYGITHVVNCTHGESKIPDYHKDKLAYFNFPVRFLLHTTACSLIFLFLFSLLILNLQISYWTLYVNTTNASVIGESFYFLHINGS